MINPQLEIEFIEIDNPNDGRDLEVEGLIVS